MTPTQYRTALEALGLTQLSAAQFLGKSVRSSHDYANRRDIPIAIAKLFSVMLELGLTHEDVNRFHANYNSQQLDQNQVEHEVDR